AGRGPARDRVLAAARAGVLARRLACLHRGHVRIPRAGTLPAAEDARHLMDELDRRQRVTLIWAGAAVVLTAFDGSVLVLALPAIPNDFHASTPALSALGSVLAIGALGAVPLAMLADRFGRRRLIAV